MWALKVLVVIRSFVMCARVSDVMCETVCVCVCVFLRIWPGPFFVH